jgi:hypothetical protein
MMTTQKSRERASGGNAISVDNTQRFNLAPGRSETRRKISFFFNICTPHRMCAAKKVFFFTAATSVPLSCLRGQDSCFRLRGGGDFAVMNVIGLTSVSNEVGA